MIHVSRALGALAVAAAILLVQIAPLSSAQAPPVNVPGLDKPVIVVTGEVTGAENWTNNFYYVLRGAVFVVEGATLNIQAGTRVIGEAGEVDAGEAGGVAQQVPGADLVAAIRRERNAMGQEQ